VREMRVAISGVFIDPVVTDGKARIAQQLIIQTGCGARHIVTWSAPFVLTGDVTFDAVTEPTLIKDWVKKYYDREIRTIYIEAEIFSRKKFRYGEVILYRRTDETRPRPRAYVDGYLVFNISGNKAVLVDDDPERILFVRIHEVRSRSHRAKIVTNFQCEFNDYTVCATQSNALAVAYLDPASKYVYCINDPPYRREREERFTCYSIEGFKEGYIGTFTDPKLAFEL